MKSRVLAIVLTFVSCSSSLFSQTREAIAALGKGMSPAEVLAVLGKPTGKVAFGTTVLWTYSKGNVEFRDLKVIACDFVSDTQFDAKQERIQKLREARKKAALERKEAAEKREAIIAALRSGDPAGLRERGLDYGDTVKEVKEVLGEPDEVLKKHHAEAVTDLFCYENGDVEFYEGKVVASSLKIKDESTGEETAKEYKPQFKRLASRSPYKYGEIAVEFRDVKGVARKFSFKERQMLVTRLITDPAKQKAIFNGIKADLRKYPASVLEKTMNTIYCIAEMTASSFGGRVGGTIDFNTMSMYSLGTLAVHHEYGHLLMMQFMGLFPEKEWKEQSRAGYQPHITHGSQKSEVENGFITPYARKNIHEDFAETFEELYVDPERLFLYADKYPRIGKKADLTMKFIEQVFEKVTNEEWSMDRDYFLKLKSGALLYSGDES